MGEIDFATSRVQEVQLFVLLKHNASAGQHGLNSHGRLVIDQVAVDDRLSVGIGKDGVTEDFGSVQRRCGGESDLHRVEIFEHAATSIRKYRQRLSPKRS